PLVQDVDVVVVGGSSGAVAAALKAAEAGAKVFLAAPRPYLGEDMAGKMRLRVGDGEDTRCKLTSQMFSFATKRRPSLPFTYESDRQAAPQHRDVAGNMLADNKWSAPENQSVQFDGDVTFVLDLGAVIDLREVGAAVFERRGNNGFVTGSLKVHGSDDRQQWRMLGETAEQSNEIGSGTAIMSVPVAGKFRYLKVSALLDKAYARQLLGEIFVYPVEAEAEKMSLADRTTPLKVKKTLDEALMRAGVTFITGTLATDLLVDAAGGVSGVVLANRSGRQAVKAKVVIDATERGVVTRSAGAKFAPFQAGVYTFKRTVIAGEAPQAEGLRVKELFGLYEARVTGVRPPKGMPDEIKGRMFECEIDISMKDGSARSFAEAEQRARDLTFVPSQLDSADTLLLVPPDHIAGVSSSRAGWQGVDALDVNVFKPDGVKNLYVLGALADVSRHAAAELMKPGNLMAAGERVGAAAAAEARGRGEVGAVLVRGKTKQKHGEVKVAEHEKRLPPYLPNTSGTVEVESRELPVLAECDVMVAGAGTGGGPAGIAAARQGARTIVCEYLYHMGGVQTEGLIGRYYYGNRVGFTKEIDDGVSKTGAVFSQSKSEWYRRENRAAGAEIWYGTMVQGVLVEEGRLAGVVVVMPDGERGVIKCKVAIDATGNAELPAMAGEETEFITADELVLQGVGQTPRNMGASYTNTDFGFLDDTDAADLFFFALRSRYSMSETVWDQSQVINSRERRRMVGAFYITPLDVLNERSYPDVVVQTASNFDSHGHTVHENFFIEDPGHNRMIVNLPYRCMLPKELEGLLVIGLGMSAHRDAMPILRMQPDIQNQGYAAGVAAAMAVRDGVTARAVNMRSLQKHLIEKQILPEAVLGWKDSFPMPDKKFTEAVALIPKDYQGLSVVLTDPKRSAPLLKDALRNSNDKDARFKYAHVLAMMGHADGEDLLIDKIQNTDWDKGWNFRGMGQFNRSVSWVDSYIIALGRAGSAKALPALLNKARVLDSQHEFSHFRAVAMALEAIGDHASAPVLAELLAKEGITGHAITMGPD
ncbi:MAG: FAD-dependent oxidoreductase, partial [Kiritimatiellae bacterium]|nr:FAD-dependent oxidoreductase [Kiritimatiellia bacterium]